MSKDGAPRLPGTGRRGAARRPLVAGRRLARPRLLAAGAHIARPRALVGGALALGGAAASVAAQRRLANAIASDPLSERLRSPARGRPLSARSADGTRLHIELLGPEEGPTFVLAHGWTEQLDYWTLVAERLVTAGFRVAAWDLRGHGASGRAAGGDYSATRFGEDVEAVLEELGAGRSGERVIVAGHSLGAISIIAWAARHPVSAKACAVALLHTGVGELIAQSLLVPVPWLAALASATPVGVGLLSSRARLPAFSTPIGHAAIRYCAFGPRASPALVAFYERMLLTCPPDVRADVGLALSRLALQDAVARIDVPVLVVAGERDRLTPPAHARRLAAALPACQRLIVLPQTGHMGPLERPEQIADALIELAESVGMHRPAGIRAPAG